MQTPLWALWVLWVGILESKVGNVELIQYCSSKVYLVLRPGKWVKLGGKVR